jgi:hypothetical protein
MMDAESMIWGDRFVGSVDCDLANACCLGWHSHFHSLKAAQRPVSFQGSLKDYF